MARVVFNIQNETDELMFGVTDLRRILGANKVTLDSVKRTLELR